MIFRYSEWRDQQDTGDLGFDELMRLFTQLLMHMNDDVHEALHWLTELDRKHNLFDEQTGMSFDEFLDWLKKEGYIEEYNDILSLTHKGSRRIRQDALKEIFSSLRKSPLGEHESPFMCMCNMLAEPHALS